VDNQYPICMNLTPRAWSALVYLRSLAEEVDPERLMIDALITAARAQGWNDPDPSAPPEKG